MCVEMAKVLQYKHCCVNTSHIFNLNYFITQKHVKIHNVYDSSGSCYCVCISMLCMLCIPSHIGQ